VKIVFCKSKEREKERERERERKREKEREKRKRERRKRAITDGHQDPQGLISRSVWGCVVSCTPDKWQLQNNKKKTNKNKQLI